MKFTVARLAAILLLLPSTGHAQPPGAAGQDAAAGQNVIEAPDWVRKPRGEDIAKVYPLEAVRRGMGGAVRLMCTTTVVGAMRDCRVIAEEPAGLGFGGAALAMSSQFLLKPAMKDGKPVEGSVTIPINFSCKDCSAMAQGAAGQAIYAKVGWLAAPSFAQVMAAYPAAARQKGLTGRVAMTCEFARDGALSHCEINEELPKGQGFARAATSLAPLFKGSGRDAAGKDMRGALVKLNVSFLAPKGDRPEVKDISGFKKLPTQDQMRAAIRAEPALNKVPFGRADLVCMVADAGALADCKSDKAEPTAFGRVAVAMASDYAASPWTEEGLPVIGTPVRFTLQFGSEPLDQMRADAMLDKVKMASLSNNLGEMQRYGDALLEHHPGSKEGASALFMHAGALQRAKRFPEALAMLQREAELYPQVADAANGACWIKATQRIALDSMMADCERAVTLQPKSAAALDSRAFAHLVLGELEAAKADYGAALQIAPTQGFSLDGRGVVKRRLGDRRGGDADIKASEVKSPNMAATFLSYGIKP